jgi:hypothetical protein
VRIHGSKLISIFLVALIAVVFLHLHPEAGNTGNPHSTTAITATKTTSTSTATYSTACTAGPDQDWIVMTSFSTSAGQFKDILADFKDAGVVITSTVEYDDINWRMFNAPLNACHAKLLQNPLIIGSLPNDDLAPNDPADDQELSLRALHVNATFKPLKDSSIEKRDDSVELYVQTGIGGVSDFACPWHLQDLSDPWAKPLTPGTSQFPARS